MLESHCKLVRAVRWVLNSSVCAAESLRKLVCIIPVRGLVCKQLCMRGGGKISWRLNIGRELARI
jgi:hypothetical protein